jgi:hypothetical protein
MKRTVLQVALLLLVLFCVSCVQIVSADATFTLAREDSWDADIILVAPGRPTSSSAVAVMQAMTIMEQNITGMGGEVTVEQQRVDENNNTPFKLSIRSASPEIINNSIFSYQVFTVQRVNGQRHVSFEMPASALSTQDVVITLRAKEIISHNGEKINRGTVRWINPREKMLATVVEGSPVNWTGWLLLLGGFGMVSTAGVLAARGKIPLPNLSTPRTSFGRQSLNAPIEDIFENDIRATTFASIEREPEMDAMFCPECGNALPPGVDFCPGCGAKIKRSKKFFKKGV